MKVEWLVLEQKLYNILISPHNIMKSYFKQFEVNYSFAPEGMLREYIVDIFTDIGAHNLKGDSWFGMLKKTPIYIGGEEYKLVSPVILRLMDYNKTEKMTVRVISQDSDCLDDVTFIVLNSLIRTKLPDLEIIFPDPESLDVVVEDVPEDLNEVTGE